MSIGPGHLARSSPGSAVCGGTAVGPASIDGVTIDYSMAQAALLFDNGDRRSAAIVSAYPVEAQWTVRPPLATDFFMNKTSGNAASAMIAKTQKGSR
jgi:hypothetical protein